MLVNEIHLWHCFSDDFDLFLCALSQTKLMYLLLIESPNLILEILSFESYLEEVMWQWQAFNL